MGRRFKQLKYVEDAPPKEVKKESFETKNGLKINIVTIKLGKKIPYSK